MVVFVLGCLTRNIFVSTCNDSMTTLGVTEMSRLLYVHASASNLVTKTLHVDQIPRVYRHVDSSERIVGDLWKRKMGRGCRGMLLGCGCAVGLVKRAG